jgi:A/G-specific adenine glycosylase
MLQQTRVQVSESYFLSFTTAFPTVLISQASEEQVLKLWQGLDIILENVIYTNSSIRSH